MALPVKDKRYTAAEYLELERQAEYKSEFVDGEIFAFAGASEAHNLIATNCIAELRGQLKETPCKLYPSDMRVQLARSTRYTYPDITVVCGEAEFIDEKRDTLTNPTLVIEILSPSTEGYDRGEKFESYRQLSSLQTYVLVAQGRPFVEVFERQAGERWLLAEHRGLDSSIPLPSVGCELQLAEVYDRIDFEQPSQEVEGERNR